MALDRDSAVFSLKDYEPQLWTCINCFCGLCVESCPVFAEGRNEIGAARGMAQIGLALLSGELESNDLTDFIAYSCTGCRWCEWNCSLNKPLYIEQHGNRHIKVSGATMAELFRALRTETGQVPTQVRDALNNLAKVGNPYGGSRQAKDKWVVDLGLKDKAENLIYLGATVPYEDRATKMAEALVAVLKTAGLELACLGSREMDSGAFAMMMGEEGLFAEMADQNAKAIKALGIKRLICLSPHDYDAFTAFYPELGGLEIKHYTQVLAELIESGRLKPTKKIEKKVTYHDPCYLGRKNNIYDEPRKVLGAIPGIELVEMEKNRSSAYCCGGGGTGLFYDMPKINMNMTRADQAQTAGAQVMAVACPICLQMLEDGVKSRGHQIEVKDVAQLIKDAL